MKPRRVKRPLADLPLASPKAFKTAEYLAGGDDDLGAFMLMAALAFNDLKDLGQHEGMLLNEPAAKEDPNAKTATRGEHAGKRAFIHRRLAAQLNEVLELVAKHSKLAGSTAFARCVARMPDFAQQAWEAVAQAAETYRDSASGDRSLYKALVAIRSNLASHYYQPKSLLHGLRAFGQSADGGLSYVSLGGNGEASRFYFADAAAQAAMMRTLGQASIPLEDLIDHAGHVMDALRMLVHAYLAERRLLS